MPTVQMPDGNTLELDYGVHDRLKQFAERTGEADALGYTPDQFAVAVAVAARDPQYRSQGQWPPIVQELIRRVGAGSSSQQGQPSQPAAAGETAGMGSPMPQPQQPAGLPDNVLPFPQPQSQPQPSPLFPGMLNPFLQPGQDRGQQQGQYRRRGQTPQDRVNLQPMAAFLRR